MRTSIRDYRKSDQGALVKMVGLVLEESQMKLDEKGTDRELENMDRVYSQKKSKFYVVESDGQLVGSIGIRPLGRDACEFRKFYVLKEYRGRGLGASLLREALIFSVEKQFKRIQLEVSSKHVRAINLYESHGFIKTNKRSSCSRCEYVFEKRLIK